MTGSAATRQRRKKTRNSFIKHWIHRPPPVLSPEQALQSFKLAPGFTIELVAAEPLVAAPVAMTWDEDGRLFVVEMCGFMPDAYGDGALYIIDMYRGIIQDQAFLTDELREQIFEPNLDKPLDRGRVSRITHEDTPFEQEPVKLSQGSPQQLIAALSHPNGWRRDTAQRLLTAMPSTSGALRRFAATGKGTGASHALWTLQAQNKLDRETVLAARIYLAR